MHRHEQNQTPFEVKKIDDNRIMSQQSGACCRLERAVVSENILRD